jgi:single-strand DNA-binding protein
LFTPRERGCGQIGAPAQFLRAHDHCCDRVWQQRLERRSSGWLERYRLPRSPVGPSIGRTRRQDEMSGSVNKVILIGNLGRDPEVRRLNSGDPVVNFSVATTESWRDKATGERKDRTEWHNVVIFNENLGRIAEQYLKKGSKVYLEGQLQTREYTDKEGSQRRTTEVVLQRFRGELTLLDNRGRSEIGDEAAPSENGSFGRSSPMERRPANAGASRAPQPTHAIDDDIPF